ncbi:MAG: anthranilate synthase component I family protein [Prevotellaceae bacterium]|jgi:anthranilate synthase component 1|nr:anthranilate synthase component I family protein [Prevotellaceae bacterium]
MKTKTKIKIKVINRKLLADLQTPVSIYLKIRDMSSQSVLLESSDYHSSENSFSFIGIEAISSFILKNSRVTTVSPAGKRTEVAADGQNIITLLNDYVHSFEISGDTDSINGFFGYTAYDTVKYLENIEISEQQQSELPEIKYDLYRFIISVNHLRNEMTLTENLVEGEQSRMDELISIIDSRNFPVYDFSASGKVSSSITDEEYKSMVVSGIEHCLRGDVFQIVLSRRFEQSFSGDDFNVYRALRSVNPSPYLFYFDFGSYRIFGSSPETHIKVENNIATIDPIAGTIHRTGDDEKDAKLAQALLADPKENAEHVMLVDLARNDLSRNSSNVYVKSHKEIQFYSHVIHMVSRVCGEILPEVNRIRLFADTFPAGTLSGAPKVRAMQLINALEKHPRGVYGGCIGYIDFNGNLNQAITIRTFVSYNNTLYYQAGAGIVAKSKPQNELAEVNNKLGALNKAIELANKNINRL